MRRRPQRRVATWRPLLRRTIVLRRLWEARKRAEFLQWQLEQAKYHLLLHQTAETTPQDLSTHATLRVRRVGSPGFVVPIVISEFVERRRGELNIAQVFRDAVKLAAEEVIRHYWPERAEQTTRRLPSDLSALPDLSAFPEPTPITRQREEP